MNKKDMFKPFHGSIDDLLNHVDKMNPDDVEKIVVDQSEDVLLNDKDAINMIMAEGQLDHETAEAILTEIKLEEVSRAIGNLLEEGLIEVSDYDAVGDPMYSLTDNGKVLATDLKSKNGKQTNKKK